MPDLSMENQFKGHIAGVDEAGRGPWAGPVVSAAVILDLDNIPQGIEDSKKLSAKAREILFQQIIETSQVGIGLASVEEIDRLNILGATKLSMQRAVAALPGMPDVALVDGNQPPVLPCPTYPVVKGDDKSLSIAAASIIAKVTRDRIMQDLSKKFSGFGWQTNQGYGTKEHQEGLKKLGVTIHHRRSFAPIRALLAEQVVV